MMDKSEKTKHSSTDSGMGLIDSDLDSSCASDAFSPRALVENSKQNTEPKLIVGPEVSHNNNECFSTADANGLHTVKDNSDSLAKMPSITVSDLTEEDIKSQNAIHCLQKSRSADDSISKGPQISSRKGRPRSVSDIRHTRSNVRAFKLTYHGSRTLNQRLTQVMIPWVIAEIRRTNTERRTVILQVSEKGLLGICEEKGSALFEHKLHNVFKFMSGYDSMFAYQWRPSNDQQSSELFILEASKKDEVDRIHDTIKHATKNALQLDSGSHHSGTHHTGLAALQELRDNNGTMFEVLYCGRVTVSHKSAPPSLVDDAIEKFKAHEREVQKKTLDRTRKRHFSSEDHLDPLSSSGDGAKECPTSPHSQSLDALDVTDGGSQGTTTSSSSGSRSGSRSGSVNSVLTNESSDRDSDLAPQDRMRSGSWNCGNNWKSNGKPKLKRQDTFVQLVTSKETSHNRTMVFQIGKSALMLISTDKKSLTLTKKFTEISYCSQGIKNPEYFGFICRENDPATTTSIFKCYVFKVQDEATVDTVMTTLRQAFAAALQQNKRDIMCESCPMHLYHKLCVEVKDLSPERALNHMRKAVESLEENQKTALASFLRLHKPEDQQGQNELIMTFLRSLYEQKQALHSHESKEKNGLNYPIQATSSPMKNETSQTEGAFSKAKKSLANSFENLISRTKSKDKSPEPTRKRGIMVSFRSQPALTGTPTPTKTDVETSPIEKSSPDLTHVISTPQISMSPLSANNGSPVAESLSSPRSASPISPPTSLSLTSSLNSDLFTQSKVPSRSSSHKEGEESPPPDGVPPTRRRSKTLGDLPSPLSPTAPPVMATATPLSPITFTTPVSSRVRVNRRKPGMPPQPIKRAMSVDLTGDSPIPLTPRMTDKRRTSFRQAIFKRVVTPMSEKRLSITDITEEADVFDDTPETTVQKDLYHMKDDANTGRFPNKSSVRGLWKRAIREQIILNRMEKENSKLLVEKESSKQQGPQNAVSESQLKMGYGELTPCIKEVAQRWETTLAEGEGHLLLTDIIELLNQGIPRHRTGEVWKFLRRHMERRNPAALQPCPDYGSYTELIKQLTTHQHAILIDLGRTYPHHPYFSNPLGRGQLSLFNLLKGYSLLDPEVGYCQGLSFVAGFLLMHMDEHDAFDMLVFIMYGLGCRRQYRPDMVPLQIQMYQLSRLLHDHHRELLDHLEVNDVGPSFYAAPWFLTFFTSQFPLGFVAGVFDMLFAQGWDAIFKVAINILGAHSDKLLRCENFEELIEYIKEELPRTTYVELEKILKQSYGMDVAKELQAYEVEYHVIQEEGLHSPGLSRIGSTEQEQLESTNQNLRLHNEELLEQLQTARNTINSQEKIIHDLQDKERRQNKQVGILYSERTKFVVALNKLLELVPPDELKKAGIHIPNVNLLSPVKTGRSNSIPAEVLLSTGNRVYQNGKS